MTTTSPTTATASSPRAGFPWTYARIEVTTTLRRLDTIFFTLIMPLGMYLLFGKMSDFESTSVGHGNVTASVMINMAAYSVAISATALTASSAVEMAEGWGRQVSLTSGGLRAYLLAKLTSATVISFLPVLLIFVAGAATGAEIGSAGRWLASLALAMTPAVPFSVFGLAAGLWVPSRTAVGVASSSVAVFAFLAGIFMPLGGVLFTIAHYTPLYGAGTLATWALQGDVVATMDGVVHEPVWYALANLVAWTVLFALACLAARRRTGARR
ncbi:MAG: ABC transporter [Actinomyces urogenitalis]|uniref:ABC transporter n=1 Tax=Actinomyces urogenitalis TaxID=103621 RepID=UPI00242EB96C|nr:ABC transporter [Actinomyces urogenitalis]MCI7457914.1 ABC transporter [Actinomyces urogenitalis]MDY3679421.1 ABC transporter [Actinomyces urogenitalis]